MRLSRAGKPRSRPTRARSGIAALAATALLSSGCLSSTHEIPREELHRLARDPPEESSAELRVVQNLGYHAEPPPAPRVHGGATIVVDGSAEGGGQPRPSGRPAGSGSGSSALQASNLAELKKEGAKTLLIAAAAVATGLAVTRGARYDGWVELHPMHPVHLLGPNGEYTYVPLAQLSPETADWAAQAYVREEEGPWRRLRRRPLERRGFSYSVFVGAGEVPVIDEEPLAGPSGGINLGYHPRETLGIGFDLGFGWTDDGLGNTVFDARYAGELSAYPLSSGRVHGGVYGRFGAASRSDDGVQIDDSSALFGGGALLQLDLTTTFAITGRAGLTRAYGRTLSHLDVGVSIY